MNDYFCVLPFYSYENTIKDNNNIYCCRLTPGTDIESVKTSIKNQRRAKECATCWRLEDQNLPSERQLHNSSFDFYLDRDIESIEKDAVKNNHQTKIVKLTTSNLCNGTCVTCNSAFSSAWAKLENKPINYEANFPNNIDFADITQLSFVGGEPLLEATNFQILESLITQGNMKCFVSMVTNGSTELTADKIRILKHFPNLNICVSIDGTGSVFEYMRYPLKWDRLLENINTYKNIAKYVSVSCMISNLNIYYFGNLKKFFEQNNLNYLCKQITSPAIFAPGNLPPEAKQLILDNNLHNTDTIKSFLNCGSYSPEMFEKLRREVRRQDSLKKISIIDYMPETAVYLNLR